MLCWLRAFRRLSIASLDFGNFFGVRQMVVGSAGQRFQYTIQQYASGTASFVHIFLRIIVASPVVSFAPFAVAIVHVIVYDQTCRRPWCANEFQFIIHWSERWERERKRNERIILIKICESGDDLVNLQFNSTHATVHFQFLFVFIRICFALHGCEYMFNLYLVVQMLAANRFYYSIDGHNACITFDCFATLFEAFPVRRSTAPSIQCETLSIEFDYLVAPYASCKLYVCHFIDHTVCKSIWIERKKEREKWENW